MIRDLGGVLIVAILVTGVLLVVRSVNRTAERKKNLSNTLNRYNICRTTIRKIQTEIHTQTAAGYFDPVPLQAILNDHEKELDS